VPQVMIYGFMGFQPLTDGFSINPDLPPDWPSLAFTRINLHGNTLDITVSRSKIEIEIKEITNSVASGNDKIFLPKGNWKVRYFNLKGKNIKSEKVKIDNKMISVPLVEGNSRKVVIQK